MKRLIFLLLAGILLFSLASCGQDIQDSQVPFYYPLAEFDHGTPDGVMAPEIHEISGHHDDLRYLLALYLQGPSDPSLRHPFPNGTILVDLVVENQKAIITLSSTVATLDGIDRTIACACLAETCFAISDVQQVQILSLVSASGLSVDTTFTRGNILLPGYEILPEDTEQTRSTP